MQQYVAAIDQGTTSTRCLVFDSLGQLRGSAQREHRQFYPAPGLVEHDPLEIFGNTERVVREALGNAGIRAGALAAVGIANQRETVVIWDRHTGQPFLNAIVWQDTRTQELCARYAAEGNGADRFRAVTGLPLATYFSGPKIRWALDHVPGLREAGERGDALCGTIDSWLVWKLTGGPRGGLHVTDVTNASRTLLMDLRTLDWDPGILHVFGIPPAMLPRIVASAGPEVGGRTAESGMFPASLPINGILGDQQAALIGQCCFAPGDVKNTYGTGCFMLLNTGERPVWSRHGLLTTVAYRFADQRPVYALEGAVAIAGALVQWLRDNLGLINRSGEVEALAASVADNGGVYFVPAFAGLFAPYWRADARGVLVGLTRYANRGHIARAALEATCYQVRDVLDAMRRDAELPLELLRVDGGMVGNELLMQFQADILGVPIVRPTIRETTALGAAYAAGLAAGVWASPQELSTRWQADKCWEPVMDAGRRERLCATWRKAVERSLNWVE